MLDTPAYTLQDQERMTEARNYLAWLWRLIAPALGRRVVEVGCGVGNFTGMLLDREIVIAVDKDHGCLERLRRRYPSHENLQLFACDASNHALSALSRFHADSCVCLNVLEHIEDDRQALENMATVVRPGGVIVLLVPAFQALYGRIDRNLGHYRRYSRETLVALAQSAGLGVRKVQYMNIAGFFAWWVNAHVLRLEAQSAKQIRVFDGCIVPWLSRLEALVRPPFGQSLFAVLKNPSA